MGSQAGNRLSLRDLVGVQVVMYRKNGSGRLTEFRSGGTASFAVGPLLVSTTIVNVVEELQDKIWESGKEGRAKEINPSLQTSHFVVSRFSQRGLMSP